MEKDEVKVFVDSGVTAIGMLSAVGALDELIDALAEIHRRRLYDRLRVHASIAVITEEERDLARSGTLSGAVRAWRDRTGLGLIEAKAAFTSAGLWKFIDGRSE